MDKKEKETLLEELAETKEEFPRKFRIPLGIVFIIIGLLAFPAGVYQFLYGSTIIDRRVGVGLISAALIGVLGGAALILHTLYSFKKDKELKDIERDIK